MAVVERTRPGPGILLLTLNRPEKRNAISMPLRDALAEAIIARQAADRVIVLSGAGGVFSAGADLAESATSHVDQRLASVDRLAGVMAETDLPVVAAIEGGAWGAGFELVLACDIIVAASDAVLALPEVRYGFIPGSGGTQRLARAAGRHRAALAILAAEPMTVSEALTLGIVSRRADTGQALDTALAIAARIAAHPAAAVTAACRAIREGVEMTLAEGLALERRLVRPLAGSDELRARAGAFVAGDRAAQNT